MQLQVFFLASLFDHTREEEKYLGKNFLVAVIAFQLFQQQRSRLHRQREHVVIEFLHYQCCGDESCALNVGREKHDVLHESRERSATEKFRGPFKCQLADCR